MAGSRVTAKEVVTWTRPGCLFVSLIEATCFIDRESHATDYMKLLLLIALYCGTACTSYCAEGHRTTLYSRKALLPKAVHMW